MLNYLKALRVAMIAHKGQKDKGGKPYIFHPLKVSFGEKGMNEKIVALLHDVVEDTDTLMEKLNFLTDEQKEALNLLTHDKKVPYFDYINNLKCNEIARVVKLSDLRHKSNLKRLKTVSEKDKKRMEKYIIAQDILTKIP